MLCQSSNFKYLWLDFIHDNISLIRFDIPGLTKTAPYLIRAGMTGFSVINALV